MYVSISISLYLYLYLYTNIQTYTTHPHPLFQVTAVTNLSLIGLMKYRMAMVYLWFIPITIVIYATVNLALPYCMHGPKVCAPHSGPCVSMAHLLTRCLYIEIYISG